MRPAFRWLPALVVLLAACSSSSTETSGGGTGAPRVLALAANAPAVPADRRSVTFTAVAGQGGVGQLFFAPRPGDDDGEGEEFLRFEVKPNSLLRRPDGTLFQPGQSVQITVTMIDFPRLIFEFQPAGLQFNPAQPATLDLDYGEAFPSFNSGVPLTSAERDIEQAIAIWKQNRPGDPFVRIGTGTIELDDKEIEIDVTSFTRYAIAY